MIVRDFKGNVLSETIGSLQQRPRWNMVDIIEI